jgi:hypothetical protein
MTSEAADKYPIPEIVMGNMNASVTNTKTGNARMIPNMQRTYFNRILFFNQLSDLPYHGAAFPA